MKKVLAILNWKGKMGYVILAAILFGLIAAQGSRLSPITNNVYELELKSLEENKSELDSVSKTIQINAPIIEKFKQSTEFLNGQ